MAGFDKTYYHHDTLLVSLYELLDSDDSDCHYNVTYKENPDLYMNIVSVNILNNTKLRVRERKTKRFFLTDCGYNFVAYALYENFTAAKKGEKSNLPLYILSSQAAALGCEPSSTASSFYPIHVTVYANINHLGHISSFSASCAEFT